MRSLDTWPWRPRFWETKARIFNFWYVSAGLGLGQWTVGFGFDTTPAAFWINLGPLIIGVEKSESLDLNHIDLPSFSWALRRFVFLKFKLELRLEFDLNIWQCGYTMADSHDHGLYFGPLNLQIEYAKCYRDPMARSDGSTEYGNLYPSTTGLPMTIWIPLHPKPGDDLPIRVNMRHGESTRMSKTAVVGVHPTLRVRDGRLSPADEAFVVEWVSLNRDTLTAFANGEIDGIKMVYKSKPVGPDRPDLVRQIWHVR